MAGEKLALMQTFLKVCTNAIQKPTACTQYFVDNGEHAYFGFTCGGYHLWRELPSKDEGRFLTAPVPAKEVKEGPFLLKGKGTLPFDDIKMSMITAKRLQYYWDLVANAEYKFRNPPMPVDWSDHVFIWDGHNEKQFLEDKNQLHIPEGWVPPFSGNVYALDVPHGEELLNSDYAFIHTEANRYIPVVLAFKRKDGVNGIIAAWKITDDEIVKDVQTPYECTEYKSITHYQRKGGLFTQTKEEKVNFSNIKTVEDKVAAAKGVAQVGAAVKTAEKESETTVPPITPTETTVKPIEPAKEVKEEKPVEIKPTTQEKVPESEQPGAEPPPSAVIAEILSNAENIRNGMSEIIKALRPVHRAVSKMEKGANDSAELKELKAKVKALESENSRLKGALKLLSEKL